MMLRKNLQADTLYFDEISEEFFYTPMPEGVIWLTAWEATQMFDEQAISVELEAI